MHFFNNISLMSGVFSVGGKLSLMVMRKTVIESRAEMPKVTFSPDSEWVAFMRATQARTRGAQGEIWMTRADGGQQLALDAANGLGVVAQADANYEPTFLPVSLLSCCTH